MGLPIAGCLAPGGGEGLRAVQVYCGYGEDHIGKLKDGLEVGEEGERGRGGRGRR